MSRSTFKLNDPVTIESKPPSPSSSSSPPSPPKPPLEGIVAYVGKVRFAEGDDWIGVRLTGDSVGQGKNDGTVKNIKYFETAAPRGGVFVRRSTLRHRTLSRLEELRLKREVKGGGSAGSGSPTRRARGGVGGGKSPRVRPGSALTSSSSLASLNEDEVSVQSVSSMLSTGSNRSRLEEIRQRRLALTTSRGSKGSKGGTRKDGGGGGDEASSSLQKQRAATTSKVVDPSQADRIEDMQLQINMLTRMNQTKEEENSAMQKSLESAEKAARDADEAREEAVSELENYRREVSEAKHDTANDDDDDDDDDNDQDKSQTEETTTSEQQPQPQTTTTTTTNESTTIQTLQTQIQTLTSSLTTTKSALTTAETQISTLTQSLQTERLSLSTANATTAALERDLNSLSQQSSRRETTASLHLKERARLEAEISKWQRRVKEGEERRVRLETNLEEVVLDKEGVEEKLEGVEERLEEAMIDAESAQIEVDELRLELEEANEKIAEMEVGGNGGGDGDGGEVRGEGGEGNTADREDVAQALSVQNSRLREAIVRLREQSTHEKMDLSRQLRIAEKSASAADALETEVTSLRSSESKLKVQVADLMETVDESRAFEKMVEELSEQVMGLEDGNVALQVLVRELEEGAEVGAEMEEAQMEEIRALMGEVQNRETIILNLEEAIKMQRRRELDFQRTVQNYKSSNERLLTEKNALLQLQSTTSESQNSAVSASQKALANVAAMAKTVSYARRKDAEATFHAVDAQYYGYLASRLESLLPSGVGGGGGGGGEGGEGDGGGGLAVARMEVMGVKGELQLGKVAVKASLGLRGVADRFTEVIKKASKTVVMPSPPSAVEQEEETKTTETIETTPIPISENLSEQISTTIHETKFAQLSIQLSIQCLRLLSLGQWPDTLSPPSSRRLSSSTAMVHSVIVPLDVAIGELLIQFKEEGSLSPHRSNLIDLDSALKNVKPALEKVLREECEGEEQGGGGGIGVEWTPPGLDLMGKVSEGKFFCLGVGSLLGAVVAECEEGGDAGRCAVLSSSLMKIDRMVADIESKSSHEAFARLLSTNNSQTTLQDVHAAVTEWRNKAEELFRSMEGLCGAEGIGGGGSSDGKLDISGETMTQSLSHVDDAVRSLAKVTSTLRESTLGNNAEEEGAEEDDGRYHHPLSPETSDPWGGITKLMHQMRIDSTIDDPDEDPNVNFLIRARSVEKSLSSAVANNAKLSVAERRIVSLEKAVSTRTKEIGMQNSRLSELENLLAQTSIVPTPRGGVPATPKKEKDGSSSGGGGGASEEEVGSLKGEIRVLTEAMDVLQTQVDDYEREIRSLRDNHSSHPRRKNEHGSRRGSSTSSLLGSSSREDSFSSLAKLSFTSPPSQKHSHSHHSNAHHAHAAGQDKTLSLEASLFRPALRLARSDASMWKSHALHDVMIKLPPLRIRVNETVSAIASTDNANRHQEEEGKENDDAATTTNNAITTLDHLSGLRRKLMLANANVRRVKASAVIIHIRSSNQQQKEPNMPPATGSKAILHLEEASSTARHALAQLPSRNGAVVVPPVNTAATAAAAAAGVRGGILARVTFPGTEEGKEEEEEDKAKIIPVVVTRRSEISELQSVLVQ